MLDPARLELLAAELLAVAGELRAEREVSAQVAPKPVQPDEPEFIGESEAARLIGLTPDALRHQRGRGGCPVVRSRRHGRRTFYSYNRAEFLAWAARRGYRPTGLGDLNEGDG